MELHELRLEFGLELVTAQDPLKHKCSTFSIRAIPKVISEASPGSTALYQNCYLHLPGALYRFSPQAYWPGSMTLRLFSVQKLCANNPHHTTHLPFNTATQAGHLPLPAACFCRVSSHLFPSQTSWALRCLPCSFRHFFTAPLRCLGGGGKEEDGRAASGPSSSMPDGMVLERPGLVKLFKPTAAWQPGGHNGSAGGGMFPHAWSMGARETAKQTEAGKETQRESSLFSAQFLSFVTALCEADDNGGPLEASFREFGFSN